MFDKYKQKALNWEDKSRAGAIDAAIRPLVDTLNIKKDYFTTSSCAGRIVLFEERSKQKSECRWLFSSHDIVDPEDMIGFEISDYPVWFKTESPILHVCCRTIDHAHRLLCCAKESGFKRSGIISANKRIIVELICTERIDTIVARDGAILVTDSYLRELVWEGNRTLVRNRKNLVHLEQLVRSL